MSFQVLHNETYCAVGHAVPLRHIRRCAEICQAFHQPHLHIPAGLLHIHLAACTLLRKYHWGQKPHCQCCQQIKIYGQWIKNQLHTIRSGYSNCWLSRWRLHIRWMGRTQCMSPSCNYMKHFVKLQLDYYGFQPKNSFQICTNFDHKLHHCGRYVTGFSRLWKSDDGDTQTWCLEVKTPSTHESAIGTVRGWIWMEILSEVGLFSDWNNCITASFNVHDPAHRFLFILCSGIVEDDSLCLLWLVWLV